MPVVSDLVFLSKSFKLTRRWHCPQCLKQSFPHLKTDRLVNAPKCRLKRVAVHLSGSKNVLSSTFNFANGAMDAESSRTLDGEEQMSGLL